MEYKKDGYTFKVSSQKNKKYDAFIKDKKITSFGDKRYEQYQDKIGFYKNKDHKDKKRKNAYYSRHEKNAVKNTAKYFSHKYLW